MKKITFPHMGNLDISARAFFSELGFDVIIPPPITKKTLDLGVKYGPEFACLPLKINLGNFIEAIEKGADVIVMGGGCGPCRFGYYGEVQKEILKENGYQFEMFMLEPNLIYDYYQIRKIFGKISIKKIINAVKITWKKIKTVDIIHKLVLKRRATEKKQGQVDKLYNKFLKEIDKTMFIDNIDFLMKKYIEMLNDTRGSFKQGVEVKIGIVGEIYLVLEPFVNLDIENILGNLGASVEKKIYLTSWLEHFLHLSYEMVRIKSAAKKYLKNSVGGHGIDSIGNTVLFANRNFDGVIQLAPFTCMPEIVSQSIIPRVSRSENIPVLSLFYDEHTADAGLKTRLEAFVDLLIRKKEMKGSISCV